MQKGVSVLQATQKHHFFILAESISPYLHSGGSLGFHWGQERSFCWEGIPSGKWHRPVGMILLCPEPVNLCQTFVAGTRDAPLTGGRICALGYIDLIELWSRNFQALLGAAATKNRVAELSYNWKLLRSNFEGWMDHFVWCYPSLCLFTSISQSINISEVLFPSADCNGIWNRSCIPVCL